jgi:hypothetical protein
MAVTKEYLDVLGIKKNDVVEIKLKNDQDPFLCYTEHYTDFEIQYGFGNDNTEYASLIESMEYLYPLKKDEKRVEMALSKIRSEKNAS